MSWQLFTKMSWPKWSPSRSRSEAILIRFQTSFSFIVARSNGWIASLGHLFAAISEAASRTVALLLASAAKTAFRVIGM
jgi:hypothetical protein